MKQLSAVKGCHIPSSHLPKVCCDMSERFHFSRLDTARAFLVFEQPASRVIFISVYILLENMHIFKPPAISLNRGKKTRSFLYTMLVEAILGHCFCLPALKMGRLLCKFNARLMVACKIFFIVLTPSAAKSFGC